jgi:hypothetical protein
VLTSLVISSLAVQETADMVDRELEALGVQGFGAKQLKWLLYWVRSELTGHFASVQVRSTLGDKAPFFCLFFNICTPPSSSSSSSSSSPIQLMRMQGKAFSSFVGLA